MNARRVSLQRFVVYHMDECLDWQGREIPRGHPYSFRGFMERHFYGPIAPELAVPETNRFWLSPATMEQVREQIRARPPHLTYGGWGQDGHVAYNQARRHPYSEITLEELAAFLRAHPGEQLGHHDGAGPADIRRGLAVRAAHVGDPRHEGMPVRPADQALLRHGRLETDGPAGGPFLPARPRNTP